MKKIAFALIALALAGCGQQTMVAPTLKAPTMLNAEATAVTQTDQKKAIKIINDDYIDRNYEKAPGGGYKIWNPSDPDDYVIQKKVYSGYKNFKFKATATPKLYAWTCTQDCMDGDGDSFTSHASGTVNLTTGAVTYK